ARSPCMNRSNRSTRTACTASGGWPSSVASRTCRASCRSIGGIERQGAARRRALMGDDGGAVGDRPPGGGGGRRAQCGHLAEGGDHAPLVAVVPRRHQPFGGVGAHDEGDGGKQPRLLDERRSPRQLDARAPPELWPPGA